MTNSINTNISAYYAQANIAKASAAATTSVSRLSSGSFITKASDDVARLSIGTSFSTTVRTLRQALVNASQGASLLQVADGALGQVTEILQRQKTLAVQASSGNLSNTDRSFLNQEFQALSQQIDFIASTASFNGVKLLNGDLSSSSRVEDSAKQSVAASATINLSEASNLVDGDVITVNGLAFTARTGATMSANVATARQEFLIGTTSADTVANLAAKLTSLTTSNAATVSVPSATYSQKLGQNTYTNVVGSATLTVTARTGGTLGERFTINASGVANNKVTVGGSYGGASVNVFSAGVSSLTSATNAVVADTTTLTSPFKSGDAITMTIGSGTAATLYTMSSGDSLTDIVDGINANSVNTGATATLTGDSLNGYNIKLDLNNVSSTSPISIKGGTNFYRAADGSQTVKTTSATSSAYVFSQSFSDTISNDATATITAASPSTTAAPLKEGDNLYASVGGGAYVAIATLAAGDGMDNIRDKINASSAAGGLGIVATIENNNLRVRYADTAQTGAISFYAGAAGTQSAVPTSSTTYNADTLGLGSNNIFGGAKTSFNVLSTGVSAPDVSLTDASPSADKPFAVNGTVTIDINTSATASETETYTVTSGMTLQGLAGAINADTSSILKGLHASVVQDSSGKYNISVSLASSAAPVAGTGGTATTNGIRVSYAGAPTLSAINTAGSLTGTNATVGNSTVNLFAQSLGNAVTLSSDITAATPAAAAAPLADSADLTIAVAGVSFTIPGATVGTTMTVQGLMDAINTNATAMANGITASFVNGGTTSSNIQLSIADKSATGEAVAALTTTQTGLLAGSKQTTAATVYQGSSTTTNTTYRLFNTAFSQTLTAGQTVVGAGPATASTPLVNGSTLSVSYGTGVGLTAINLTAAAGLATNDTLSDIVDKINARTATTGFTARLDGNGTNVLLAKDPNIATAFNPETSTSVYFSGGTGQFSGNIGDAATAAGVYNGPNVFNNNYSTVNLFTSNLTSVTATSFLGTVFGTNPPTAATPFNTAGLTGVAGSTTATFNITVNGINITGLSITSTQKADNSRDTAGTNTTVQDLLDAINTNANAKAAGITAVLTGSGTAGANIQLRIADSGNTGIAATGLDTTVSATNGAHQASTAQTNTATTFATTTLEQRLSRASYAINTTSSTALMSSIQSNIGLRGGQDTGIGYGSVSATGSVSSSLVTALANKSAIVSLAFADTDPSAISSTFVGKTLAVGGVTFTFASAPSSPTEIKIGDNLQDTIDNAVSALKRYTTDNATGDAQYQLKQMDFTRSGNNLVFSGKGISNVTKLDGTAASTIASNVSNAVVSNAGALTNATRSATGTFGVDVSGVNNVDFSGKLQGFTATSTAADTVTLSVKVGNNTYTASNVNTNPAIGAAGADSLGNQTIRFYSDSYTDANGRDVSGGFFDVQLAANQGRTVANQSQADAYGVEFNAALQGLSFSQTRVISSYKAEGSIINASGTSSGSLVGTSVSAKLPSFDNNKLTTISVSPSTAANPDAEVSLNIDGVKYTSRGLGSQLGANQTYKFISATDPNNFVSFTTGNTAIDLSTAENAKAFQTALYTGFGVSEGSSALSFQIGTSSAESLGVSIGAASTDSIFGGETLSISTLQGAATASDAIDKALGTVTSIRANVGALQSRFNFASANIQISVQNQDASRSELLDTDIAAESTNYATAQVQLQAGISVLAQANQQLQNLLKLLG